MDFVSLFQDHAFALSRQGAKTYGILTVLEPRGRRIAKKHSFNTGFLKLAWRAGPRPGPARAGAGNATFSKGFWGPAGTKQRKHKDL